MVKNLLISFLFSSVAVIFARSACKIRFLDKWTPDAPGQMGSGKNGIRTNRPRTNGPRTNGPLDKWVPDIIIFFLSVSKPTQILPLYLFIVQSFIKIYEIGKCLAYIASGKNVFEFVFPAFALFF